MKLDRLFQSLLLTSAIPSIALLLGTSVQAEELREDAIAKNIPLLSDIQPLVTSAQILVQTPTPTNPPNRGEISEEQVVPITGVKANRIDKGVEVILQTPQAKQLQVVNRSSGNNFIADIPNAQLKLPSGDTFKFSSEKPLKGITQITVINLDANTVRITATGETALPKVELFDSGQGLIFGLASAALTAQKPDSKPETEEMQQPETKKPAPDGPIELLVTGRQDGYRVPEASTATKTDTILRDIPQAIQVIPRQVLQDQQVRR